MTEVNNIFITGATGFLGSHLLRTLLPKETNRAYVLIRAKNKRFALKRIDDIVIKTFSKSVQPKVFRRINIIRGDIAKEDLGICKRDSRKLQNTINTIYHCAAVREFGQNLNSIRKVNVNGTQNLLRMALGWRKKGYLENINHISTAYIAGNYKSTFYESEVDVHQGFNNSYEQSKFEAELITLKYRKRGLPVDIYRPSIITNCFSTNEYAISAPLMFLSVFTLGIFKKFPADRNTELNMIPVDIVAKAIYLISITKDRPANRNYHIVNPKAIKFGCILDTASAFFGFRKPQCIPLRKFSMDSLSSIQRKIVKSFVPYLNQNLSFDMHNASSILKKYNFKIPRISREVLNRMFGYYKLSGLIPEGSNYAVRR